MALLLINTKTTKPKKMKIRLSLVLSLLLTFAYGQKKELKKAEKLFASGNFTEATQILDDNQSLLEGAEDKISTAYMFLRGKLAQQNGEFEKALDYFTQLKDDVRLKADVQTQVGTLSSAIITSAIEDNEAKDFVSSAQKLYLAYTIDPDANQDYLYFAASNSVNGSDYEAALKYYNLLKDLNYTGITKKYFVTEVASNQEMEVSETEFNIFQKSGDYTNPREEETPSKYPEIVKNIALIYAQQGQRDMAINAVQEAREANPDDLNLILTEANLYIELGDKERFKSLISQAIAQDPNNANLYFNLGVVNADLGDKDAARTYYQKAIELDPNFEASYLNLVALILEGEAAIVEEMNSLGTSRKDNMRYDELKKVREGLYKECIPILKGLITVSSDNEEAIKTLMNIYGTLGDNQGYMEMKKLLEGAE
jgi:tetratricopeptide (TPR) repeat protein